MATKVQSLARPVSEQRAILGPTGNRVRASQDPKRKTEVPKKPKKPAPKIPEPVIRNNASVDSSCSSESSTSSAASAKRMENSRRSVTAKRNGVKNMKVVPHASAEIPEASPVNSGPIKRKLFDNFDISSVSQFTEKKLLSLKVNGSLLLSEPKLRAIVENAKQMLKVQQEFGSFSKYCWNFVNHAPVRNGFRYARQVPVKTPKAELISKDLMQKGFRCVGPTVVYSFMQVSGIVNDHLLTCFRYQQCNADAKKDLKTKIEEMKN
ncbi:DNA glycosylase superfamily protein [Citrus sinensis]|nr:DNA glycosylase superfamily protein [Citrus sinensis]